MKRKFLFALYQSPRGKLLKTMEGQFLKRSITVSCKQQQLQIGGLGWEEAFIDCSLYRNYCILDAEARGYNGALRIKGKAYNVPVQTESMDLVILPHLLEFDAHWFHTMREIERVLKPGGEIIILNFNPFSLSVRYQFLLEQKWPPVWFRYFISRSRIMDWLKLTNFEILTTAEFYLDTFTIKPGKFQFNGRSIFSMAYAVKAVKRRYRLIPIGKVSKQKARFATARNILDRSIHRKN